MWNFINGMEKSTPPPPNCLITNKTAHTKLWCIVICDTS